ncbi:MAG: DUF503 domain-containing protein [Chloroflexota bacterium]
MRSLKEKRRIVKSILAHMHEFNLAAAEIDALDLWQTAVIGLAAISNDRRHLHSVLEKAVDWIETQRPDAPINTYFIEFR